jgi:protein ImuB
MHPRALAEGQRVRVVSLAGGRHGVRAGMGVPEARAACAALDVRPWDDRAIADAILAVTTALLAASPQVTPVAGAPGMWWVGATGFERLGGDEALGHALLDIVRVWHPDARVAVADSCVAARAATWAPAPRSRAVRERDPGMQDGLTCIPAGGCAHYLAPAPLGLVPMDDELRSGLHALGLRTVGAFAALEAGDVERRWGADGLTAWRLSHGDDPRRPGLVRVEAARSASVELPGPAESTGPVLFVLRALLERLVRELVQDARAAASVAITLVLDAGRQWPLDDEAESGAPALPALTAAHAPAHAPVILTPASLLAVPHRTITRETRPARPLARLDPLFDQCRALLEQWSIPAPIIGVTVSIPATAPLAADQGDLLIPSWRDAAMNADAVFTRLRAALDPDGAHDVVVHPVAGDTHRPEEAARWEQADAMLLAASPPPAACTAASLLPAVLRMLDTPEAVEVEEADGLPDAVWWRGRRLSFASIDGPERLSGDWWRPDAYARDYWRATVTGEGELLLYREAANGVPGWYVQGWYD